MFGLLEGFADGYGGWDFQGVLGKPLVEMDESLVDDLITLRWLKGIAERIKSAKKDNQGKDGQDQAANDKDSRSDG